MAGKTNSVYFDAFRTKAYDGGGEENLTYQVLFAFSPKFTKFFEFCFLRAAPATPAAAWTRPPASASLPAAASTYSSFTSQRTTTRRLSSPSGEQSTKLIVNYPPAYCCILDIMALRWPPCLTRITRTTTRTPWPAPPSYSASKGAMKLSSTLTLELGNQ